MDRSDAIRSSWDSNAARWTRAVRAGAIESRAAGTDAAIVAAVTARRPARFLDAGCGEGWLVRRVAEIAPCEAAGIDESAALIAAARAADPAHRYEVLGYRDLVAGRCCLGGRFDIIAFNFSLFDEDAAAVLAAAGRMLGDDGAVIVQTIHPAALPPEERDRDGWRTENFGAFAEDGWAPMLWFYRTADSWRETVRAAGLSLVDVAEPAHRGDGAPLSLLLACGATKVT